LLKLPVDVALHRQLDACRLSLTYFLPFVLELSNLTDIQLRLQALEQSLPQLESPASRLQAMEEIARLQRLAIQRLEESERAVADANVHIASLYMELEDAQDLILQQKSEILQQNEELNASVEQLKMVNEHLEELNAINRSLQQEQEQSRLVRQAHKALVSSVNYSKRIQFNLLPDTKSIQESYREFFALYLPRDIVSGDYYWFQATPHYNILVTADCTGHGVSGAFMMLIGHNLLDKLVCQWGLYDPADLLHEMNVELRKTLKQQADEDLRDSMEMTIFVDNRMAQTVEVASAKRPFVRISQGEAFLIKGDKFPVGDAFYPVQSFQKHTFPRQHKDRYYFFSDGITDQFGGDENRKLTTKGFLGLLDDMQNMPMQVQQFRLQQFFKKWKGTHRQLDDVMVVGLEIPSR
jgi:serine phosphatase RsbU (regulator of sigma subunit)